MVSRNSKLSSLLSSYIEKYLPAITQEVDQEKKVEILTVSKGEYKLSANTETLV